MSRKPIVLVVLGASLLAAPCALAGQSTYFSPTGTEQTYTVPAGVTQVHIKAEGPSGGRAAWIGGRGAAVEADLPVTPGEILYVNVGGHPGNGDPTGGFNGGGSSPSGIGGGGATDIRLVPGSLASRVVVAGGGGGGTGSQFGGDATAPVAAGGMGATPGHGAIATAGGLGGGGGADGVLGLGGAAATNGGAGGGGVFGGGGGAGGAGGGGGSSAVLAPAANGTFDLAWYDQDGSATITTGPPTVHADDVDFGTQRVGGLAVRQVVLTDSGYGPFALDFTPPAITGPGSADFLLGTTNCIGAVWACRIPVLFFPGATGQTTATLTITTDDPAGPLAVALSGTGTPAASASDEGDAKTTTAAPAITYVTQTLAAPTPATTTPPPAAATGKRMALLTCHTGPAKVLRCRSVSVPAGATLPGKSLYNASLTNKNAQYGTGTARVTKSDTQILLTTTRKVAAGRYTKLTLTRPGARTVTRPVVVG
ncbi:glycine-rich protein [Baekduia sp. Peel2402]|uniref:glycine-rich protein n=1 Tax=Baekduia sp. Peel2402 TaxID=3458296 RepID=UPI00403EB5F5